MENCNQCGGPLGTGTYKLPFKMALGNTALLPVCRGCYEERTRTNAAPSGNAAQQGSMFLFLFNSDTPSANADASYGAFSETTLLKHLFAALIEGPGQNIGKTELKACHGDLFERHPLGDSACTLRILGNMMRTDNLDGSRLVASFDASIRKGETVGFIPWAVGLSPLPETVATRIHDALKVELPEFYLGIIPLGQTHDFESTASRLSLPQTMRIRGGQLVGDWLGKSPLGSIGAPTETAGVDAADQGAVEQEVLRLIRAGNKIGAIKLYREKTGVGLKEAKDAVEQGDFSGLHPIHVQPSGAPEEQALTLLRAGKKIEAIKLWRERTGKGLKDSKDAVEALAHSHNIEVKSESGCFIATAVCGGESHEVLVLRRFRDTILARTCVGRSIIAAYSVSSPPLAQILARHSGLKRLTAAMVIRPISRLVERRFDSANNRVEHYGA